MTIPKHAMDEILRSPYYVVFMDNSNPKLSTFVRVKDYDESEYLAFIDARQKIEKNILQFNDLYFMVAQVYEDFISAYNGREEALKNNETVAARDDLVALNSYFVSFIANLGMYLAVVPRKISSKRKYIKEVHTKATNEEYNNSFAYRLIVNLRNYAIHNSPPITGIKGGNWMAEKEGKNYEYEIFIEKKEIIKDADVARKLAKDFESDVDKFPVVESITETVKSLKNIHWKTIKALLAEVEEPIALIEQIYSLTEKQNKPPYIASYNSEIGEIR
jgi:hypothetical protein